MRVEGFQVLRRRRMRTMSAPRLSVLGRGATTQPDEGDRQREEEELREKRGGAAAVRGRSIFSAKSGVSQQALSAVNNGNRRPRRSRCVKWKSPKKRASTYQGSAGLRRAQAPEQQGGRKIPEIRRILMRDMILSATAGERRVRGIKRRRRGTTDPRGGPPSLRDRGTRSIRCSRQVRAPPYKFCHREMPDAVIEEMTFLRAKRRTAKKRKLIMIVPHVRHGNTGCLHGAYRTECFSSKRYRIAPASVPCVPPLSFAQQERDPPH